MGQVLLKLDDKHEALLRELSEHEFKSKKGSLIKIVEKALDEYAEKAFRKQEKRKALKELDEIVEKNAEKLKIGYKFKREDVYAERINRL